MIIANITSESTPANIPLNQKLQKTNAIIGRKNVSKFSIFFIFV